MNRDDIIRMAQECGLTINGNVMLGVEHFAKLVAAAEREACARVCEDGIVTHKGQRILHGVDCAKYIRERGEQSVGKSEQMPTVCNDYLEKCPNCNGPADNGFDRSWPDPNPYFCTKCMKAMGY